MAVILVTGMSGTGKSATLRLLAERGYPVLDTDYGGWIVLGPGGEPAWDEARMAALIARHEQTGEPLFVAGTVWNQQRFYARFAQVVLLSAPEAVLLERVANRTGNAFGKTAGQRDRIRADIAEIEPRLRSVATVEIDTRAPLSDVVETLAGLMTDSMTNS
ncbi:AAA family ATPase [Nocardia sp. NPDC004722]